ncbi:unnamed protein product [Spirodela intermedia]|uniref:Uncharacterized protein n=1 Tax=Spirodela intermedia TaxID=51605 RepID=A0A7I8LGH9_SPIIN|nr:unnamed protein product [Spirodela intermedia]
MLGRRSLNHDLISLESAPTFKTSKSSKPTRIDNLSENLDQVNEVPKSLNEYFNPSSGIELFENLICMYDINPGVFQILPNLNENTYDHLQEFLKICHTDKDLKNEINEINKKLEKLLSSQGELKPIGTILSLGDRSIRYPKGLIEDFIINIEGCYFLVDFLVLDMMPPENSKESAIILGRPFLPTASANINCATRIVDIYGGGHHILLNVFKAARFAKEEDEGEEYDLEDHFIYPISDKKTIFTCSFGTFAFTKMPFGLCNALITFQRCMMSLFSDMLSDF